MDHAMKPTDVVTTLSRLAGRAEPPPLEDADGRRFVDHAMRAEPRRERRTYPWLAAAAVAAIATAWLAWPRAREPRVLELTLPTGDHLAGVAGARFEVEEVAPAHRRIRLHDGEVMFDVAHVVPGQRFEVATDHLVATAKGTVFSVAVDADGSHVRVFDGVVAVEQAGRTHLLVAGAVWDSTRSRTAIAFAPPSVLAPSVEHALRARVIAPPAAPTIATRAITTPAIEAAVATRAIEPRVGAPSIAAPPPEVAPPPGSTSTSTSTSTSAPSSASIATSSSTSPWSTDSVPVEQLSLDRLLATARGQLTAADFANALATADIAARRAPWSSTWWQIVGDAQRGLGHAGAAAIAFEHVTGAERSEAGYTAAYLRHHDLHDATAALATLDASGASNPGSPLEERALGLRAQILVALGRKGDAAEVARRYLTRFPHADLRAYMVQALSAGARLR
jgi:hypothetical protein